MQVSSTMCLFDLFQTMCRFYICGFIICLCKENMRLSHWLQENFSFYWFSKPWTFEKGQTTHCWWNLKLYAHLCSFGLQRLYINISSQTKMKWRRRFNKTLQDFQSWLWVYDYSGIYRSTAISIVENKKRERHLHREIDYRRYSGQS